MDPRRSTVVSGTATLNVLAWGSVGPHILALHPGVGDSRIWKSCASRWAERGYRVTGYDRRGFGFTHSSPEPHDDVVDLLAVMNAMSIDSAVVVGNSKGGGVALDLALQNPDRVRALVLVAPSPTGYDYDDWPTTTAEAEQDLLIAAAETSADLELVNALETRYWLDGTAQPEGRVSGEPRQLFADMNKRALHASPIGDTSIQHPVWPRLEQIEIPTLVAVGEFDLPGIRNQCRELVEQLPIADLIEIPQTAHCPQLDQSEVFANVVLEFLEQLAS